MFKRKSGPFLPGSHWQVCAWLELRRKGSLTWWEGLYVFHHLHRLFQSLNQIIGYWWFIESVTEIMQQILWIPIIAGHLSTNINFRLNASTSVGREKNYHLRKGARNFHLKIWPPDLPIHDKSNVIIIIKIRRWCRWWRRLRLWRFHQEWKSENWEKTTTFVLVPKGREFRKHKMCKFVSVSPKSRMQHNWTPLVIYLPLHEECKCSNKMIHIEDKHFHCS